MKSSDVLYGILMAIFVGIILALINLTLRSLAIW